MKTPHPANAAPKPAERLSALRDRLATDGLAGFIVPHADEHQSEYLPASAERLAWLTGFSGSAGMAIVLRDSAALFVDGRYTTQAAQQAYPGFAREHLIENPPAKWLAAHAKKGERIGYDPWLLTVSEVRRFGDAAASAGAELVAVSQNPLDAIWMDRPEPPQGQMTLHPTALAGETADAKIARLQAELTSKKVDAAVITQADSIAWLLNVRGTDIAHNPVTLAYLVLPAGGKPQLFIDGRKLSNSVRDGLTAIAEPDAPVAFLPALRSLAGKRVLIDPQTANAAIAGALGDAGATLVEGSDPVVLPRARKNATEIAGTRNAHLRDGAAMVRFLAWFDREAQSGRYDETALADTLRDFRADTARRDGSELVDLSFDTISGAGPNGAVIHYRVTPETNRKLLPGELYLIDSGAQYRDGTTDITRTLIAGTPTAEMRDRYTRVLKGHLAIATARFPAGTTGAQLDPFARRALWDAGLDFDHGTGHGVGVFLAVHEGPARIAKTGMAPLEPGMILSNEPGYYKVGAYGIRIENLELVTPAQPILGGDRPMMGFETLTFAPYDRRLIDVALLTPAEIAWVDAYHAALLPKLGRLLDDGEKAWLAEATRAIS